MYTFHDLMQFDREQAGDFLLSSVKTGYLTLKHPTKDVVTHCRASQRYRKANVLLFSDAESNNHWYLIQIYNLVDGYICGDDVFNPLNAGEISELSEKLSINNLSFNLSSQNTQIDGFLFSQVRPYHYIYDQFATYFQLSEREHIDSISFTDNNCFYRQLPNNQSLKTAKDDGCYLFPCTKGSIYDDVFANKMHEFIRSNSSPISIDSDLVLWVGITAQKRSWMEQIEGQYRIVKALQKHHSSITVIVDGWTSLADGVPDSPKDIARDMAVYESLKTRLSKLRGVNVIKLIGKDYNEKVSYARRVDYFIANSGTGGMVPMMFAKTKGVIHSNSKLHTFERAYDSNVKIVPNAKIMAQNLSLDSGVYSIDWKVIYNLLMELMSLEERLTESSILKNKLYFNFKKFIFKKNIQIGMAIKKLKPKAL